MDLKNFTPDEIKDILEKHLCWLKGEDEGRRADLANTDLSGARLDGASLVRASLPAFQIVPEEGGFIAWKRVRSSSGDLVLLKLEIPADAKRTSSLVGRKCRASKVRVVEAIGTTETEFRSMRNNPVAYRVGEVTEPSEEYNHDIRVECASGIHFFITRAEAQVFTLWA